MFQGEKLAYLSESFVQQQIGRLYEIRLSYHNLHPACFYYGYNGNSILIFFPSGLDKLGSSKGLTKLFLFSDNLLNRVDFL